MKQKSKSNVHDAGHPGRGYSEGLPAGSHRHPCGRATQRLLLRRRLPPRGASTSATPRRSPRRAAPRRAINSPPSGDGSRDSAKHFPRTR